MDTATSCGLRCSRAEPGNLAHTRLPREAPSPGCGWLSWSASEVPAGPQSTPGPRGQAPRQRASTCLPSVFSKREPCRTARGSQRSWRPRPAARSRRAVRLSMEPEPSPAPLSQDHIQGGPPSSALCLLLCFLFIFWPYYAVCGISVPWPGMEPTPLALKHSLNHWTARAVPQLCSLKPAHLRQVLQLLASSFPHLWSGAELPARGRASADSQSRHTWLGAAC